MWRTLYFKYLCVNYTGNNLLLYNFKKKVFFKTETET